MIFDVVILGGGPAGLKAAQDAATFGKTVAVVDPLFLINRVIDLMYARARPLSARSHFFY